MLYDVIVLTISVLFIGFILMKILPGRGIGQITADELRGQLKNEAIQFVDVRSPAHYEQFHIYGFHNIPLRDIRSSANTLSKDKKVVLICQTGTKGNEAAKRLKRKGFKDIDNVRGGLSAWDPVRK